jgi:hypothetical protein
MNIVSAAAAALGTIEALTTIPDPTPGDTIGKKV